MAPVERAVMSFCSDQMNLLRLQQPVGPSGDLQQGVMISRKHVVDLEAQLGRITEALALGRAMGYCRLRSYEKPAISKSN